MDILSFVSLSFLAKGKNIGCQDTSDQGHFGPKTFRHHQTGAEMSGQFGTNAEVSRGHFGTGIELSRPPANIFASIGRTEERFNIIGYYYYRGPLVYTKIHRRGLATIFTYNN